SNPSATLPVTGVVVSDPIPAGMTFASASPAATTAPGVGANGTVTWNVGTVAAGATATLTLNVNVTTSITGTTSTNTATLTNNYTSSTNTVAVINITNGGSGYASAPVVTINGGGGTGATATAIVSGGAVVAINIASGGTGFTSAPSVTIAPPGAGTTATATAAIAAVTVSGQSFTFNVGNLAIGATATFVVTVRVATTGLPAGQNQITNTASVSDAYNTAQRTSSAVVTITANPNLTLTESATPSAQRVVFVSVTNGGSYPTPPTVSISGCTSAPTAVVSTSPAAGLASGSYSVTGVTITNAGGGCTGPMLVSFSGSGGAAATATVGPAPGDTITYAITLTNTGAADA